MWQPQCRCQGLLRAADCLGFGGARYGDHGRDSAIPPPVLPVGARRQTRRARRIWAESGPPVLLESLFNQLHQIPNIGIADQAKLREMRSQIRGCEYDNHRFNLPSPSPAQAADFDHPVPAG